MSQSVLQLVHLQLSAALGANLVGENICAHLLATKMCVSCPVRLGEDVLDVRAVHDVFESTNTRLVVKHKSLEDNKTYPITSRMCWSVHLAWPLPPMSRLR